MSRHFLLLLFSLLGAGGQQVANPASFCYNLPGYRGTRNLQRIQEEFQLCPDTHPLAFDGGQQCCNFYDDLYWSNTTCSGEISSCPSQCCESYHINCHNQVAFNRTGKEQFDGLYEKVEENGKAYLEANRPVYQKNDSCVWWHRGGRHWWVGPCSSVGTDSGYAYLEEDYYCPFGNGYVIGGSWRKADSNELVGDIEVVDGFTFEAQKPKPPPVPGQSEGAPSFVSVPAVGNTATAGVNVIIQKTSYKQVCKPKLSKNGKFVFECLKPAKRPKNRTF